MTKPGVLLREKHAIAPNSRSRVMAQRFCPGGVEGHKLESSEALHKGTDFIIEYEQVSILRVLSKTVVLAESNEEQASL